jgi:hypothetical protein
MPKTKVANFGKEKPKNRLAHDYSPDKPLPTKNVPSGCCNYGNNAKGIGKRTGQK